MTTLQEAAMRKALELGKRYAKCLMMNQAPFDEAIESLRTALAQQASEEYKRGFNDGMKEAPTGECWIRAIDEAMVGAHLGIADMGDDYGTAKKKLNDLICWSVEVDRELAQQGDPVAWRHNCNALCTDGLELWIDHCPHCGKPRTTHAEQWPPGLITDIVLTVTALHKEVDIGWSPDARSHLLRLSTSIGMLAAAPSPQPAHECTRSHPHERMDMCCELRTEIARLTNENARLKAAPQPAQGVSEDDAAKAVSEVMEQAQVFASAWALVGGRFDNGNAMDDADEAKAELRTMVVSLARAALQSAQPEGGNQSGKQQLPPLPTTELAARASGL